MTRAECESKIFGKMLEIMEIYSQYNPNGSYLDLCFVDGSIQGTNGKDKTEGPVFDFWHGPFKNYLYTLKTTDDRGHYIGLDGKEVVPCEY